MGEARKEEGRRSVLGGRGEQCTIEKDSSGKGGGEGGVAFRGKEPGIRRVRGRIKLQNSEPEAPERKQLVRTSLICQNQRGKRLTGGEMLKENKGLLGPNLKSEQRLCHPEKENR